MLCVNGFGLSCGVTPPPLSHTTSNLSSLSIVILIDNTMASIQYNTRSKSQIHH